MDVFRWVWVGLRLVGGGEGGPRWYVRVEKRKKGVSRVGLKFPLILVNISFKLR